MKIYLVRHGEATSKAADSRRPLTAQGRQDVEKMAAFVKGLDLQVEEIRHSGKTRAAQTAEILGAALAPSGGVVEGVDLDPNDPVKPLKRELSKRDEDLMVVGHLPFLARLASELLGATKSKQVVTFPPAGMACLERGEDGTWSVCWVTGPDLLR